MQKKEHFGTGLPNLFINIAVPVNFFHLDFAVGIFIAGFTGGFAPLESAVELPVGVPAEVGPVELETTDAAGCPTTVALGRPGGLTDGVEEGCR